MVCVFCVRPYPAGRPGTGSSQVVCCQFSTDDLSVSSTIKRLSTALWCPPRVSALLCSGLLVSC